MSKLPLVVGVAAGVSAMYLLDPGRGRLQLPCLARLHVIALLSEVLQDPRLRDLALERLERPIEAIALFEMNLDHL